MKRSTSGKTSKFYGKDKKPTIFPMKKEPQFFNNMHFGNNEQAPQEKKKKYLKKSYNHPNQEQFNRILDALDTESAEQSPPQKQTFAPKNFDPKSRSATPPPKIRTPEKEILTKKGVDLIAQQTAADALATKRREIHENILNKLRYFKVKSVDQNKIQHHMRSKIEGNAPYYYNFLGETDSFTLKVLAQVLYDEIERMIMSMDSGMLKENIHRVKNEIELHYYTKCKVKLMQKNEIIRKLLEEKTVLSELYNQTYWTICGTQNVLEEIYGAIMDGEINSENNLGKNLLGQIDVALSALGNLDNFNQYIQNYFSNNDVELFKKIQARVGDEDNDGNIFEVMSKLKSNFNYINLYEDLKKKILHLNLKKVDADVHYEQMDGFEEAILDKQAKSYQSKIKEINDENEANLAAIENQLEILKDELGQISSENTNLQKKLKQLQDENNQERNISQKLQNENNQERNKNSYLQNENNQERNKNSFLQNEMQKLKLELKARDEEKAENDMKLERLAQEHNQIFQKFESIKKDQISNFQNQINDAVQQLFTFFKMLIEDPSLSEDDLDIPKVDQQMVQSLTAVVRAKLLKIKEDNNAIKLLLGEKNEEILNVLNDMKVFGDLILQFIRIMQQCRDKLPEILSFYLNDLEKRENIINEKLNLCGVRLRELFLLKNKNFHQQSQPNIFHADEKINIQNYSDNSHNSQPLNSSNAQNASSNINVLRWGSLNDYLTEMKS